MPLNVVSALTRLGVDPWDEAARLSALPTAVAVGTLAADDRPVADPSTTAVGLEPKISASRLALSSPL